MKDINQMTAEEIEAELSGAPAMAAKPVEELSEQEILAELGMDPDKPQYTNGSTATSALNKTFLSPTERFKLKGLGNAKGIASTLAETYGEGNVVATRDGDFRIKNPKDNLWYTLDPKTFDSKDPAEFTKSIVSGAVGTASVGLGVISSAAGRALGLTTKDPLELATQISEFVLPQSMEANAKEAVGEVAENAFEIGGTAAGLATLPVTATGIAAAGLIAGGITAIRSTLGKAEGTYDATPAEQMLEIGMDTLMGVVGQGLMPGVKFSAKQLAKSGFGRAAQEFGDAMTKKAGPGFVEDMARSLSKLTGWTDRTFETYLKDGEGVQKLLTEVAQEIPENQGTLVLSKKINYAKETAENLIRGADDLWAHNQDQLIRLAPKDKEFAIKEMVKPWVTNLEEAGVLVPSWPGASKEAVEQAQRLGTGMPLGEKTLEFMPFDDFQKMVTKNADLPNKDFAYSKQTYDELKALYQKVRNLADETVPGANKGVNGLKNSLEASKILKNFTYEMRNAGLSVGSNPMIKNSAVAAEAFDNGFIKMLGGDGEGSMGAAFRTLNKDWTDYSEAVTPFKEALARGDQQALARLGDRLISKPKSTNVNELDGIVKAREVLNNVPASKPKTERLAQLEKEFRRIEAVQLIQKMESKPLMSTGGMGVAGMGLSTGNAPVVISSAGSALLNSPRTAKFLIDKSKSLAELVKRADGPARAQVLMDPRVIKTLLAYPTQAAQAHYETEQMLKAQVPGAQ